MSSARRHDIIVDRCTPDGRSRQPGYMTFDRPSDQFGGFGNAEVSEVGLELDHKLAALLEYLSVSVPDELRTP